MDKLNFSDESTLLNFKEEMTNIVSKSFDFEGDVEYYASYVCALFAFTINFARSNLQVPQEALDLIYKQAAKIYNDAREEAEKGSFH